MYVCMFVNIPPYGYDLRQLLYSNVSYYIATLVTIPLSDTIS